MVVIVWIFRDAESWEAVPVRPVCLILLFCAIACYSHWTNVFLLLPAVIISLLAIREISFRRRVAIAAVLTVLMGAMLLPVGLLAAMLHKTDNNFLVYMDLGNSPWVLLRGIPARGLKWFSAGCEMFSPAGLLLGITGLVWIAKGYRILLPVICLAVHFSAYSLIPGFIWNGSPTWLRTYNYVLPLLSIGVGAMLAVAWRGLRRWPVAGRLVVGVLFLLYIDQQIPKLHAAEWLENRSPDFYSNYLAGQGDLGPTVAGLEESIPEEAQIFFWDYPLRQLYQSLNRSSGRNPMVASTITSTLAMGGKRNRFYESPRTLPLTMYVVTPGTVSPGELQNALLVILQTAGVQDVRGILLSAKGRWETSSYGTIVLYDVRWT